ncbi:hypothetical protein ASA1KI_12660 [Opitutales bacterium ASA1]|uniref:delta-60 repeat domain-containing protein n=1 Tax=Congregicoccus parvus TaxID=3081749 RepID=UPI002B30B967|nr:hypothetical protein ASA1KI_12660 [Opitutales bacterium ASA1]
MTPPATPPFLTRRRCRTWLAHVLHVVALVFASTSPATPDSNARELTAVRPVESFRPRFERIGGSVFAIGCLADGKFYVAGDFTSFDGSATTPIVRLNADGSRDTGFAPRFDYGRITRLAVLEDDRVLAAGTLAAPGGTARTGLFRLNTDGTIDPTFAPAVTRIEALAVQADGKIIVGGSFTTVGSVPRNGIARLHSDGTLDAGFDPGSGVDGTVLDVAIQVDGRILVAGSFTTVNGAPRSGLARLVSSGALDESFSIGAGFAVAPGFYFAVRSIALQVDQRIVVAGLFFTFASESHRSLVRLNSDGTLDDSFATTPVLLEDVNFVTVRQGHGIYTVGIDQTRRFTFDGAIDRTFAAPPTSNGTASGLNLTLGVLADGSVIVGGLFSSAGVAFNVGEGTTHQGIVRLSGATGAIDESYNPVVLGQSRVSRVLPEPSGSWLVVGDFDYVDGVPRRGMARVFANGDLDTGFDPGARFDKLPWTFAIQPDGRILAGGSFTSFEGTTANRLARLTVDGTLDSTFVMGSGFDDTVNSIALQSDGKVVAAGTFHDYGGVVRHTLARLHTDGTLDQSFDPGTGLQKSGPMTYPPVIAVHADGKVVASGSFDTYDGAPRAGIVQILASGAVDPGFEPPGEAFKFGGAQFLYAVEDGKVLCGTSAYLGSPINGYFARLRADGSKDASFSLPPFTLFAVNGPIGPLQSDGKVFVPGRFLTGSGHRYLGRFDTRGGLDESFSIPTAVEPPVATCAAFDASGRLAVGGDWSRFIDFTGQGLILLENVETESGEGRLLNLSTRAQALTGDDTLIPGFVLSGSGTKRLLVRAVGPTLEPSFGVPGVLADPRLRVLRRNTLNGNFDEVATNDDWTTQTGDTFAAADIVAVSAQVGAFSLLADSTDAALLLDLVPGHYTAPASGADGGTGVAIVEVYDADTGTPTADLVNISNRGFVGTGADIMIPGFVVSNAGPRTFLLRAVGPTLAAYNVKDVLADPILTLFRGSSPILMNDDWGDDAQAAVTAVVAAQVGAFPLPVGSTDAAVVVTLPPGGYTLHASGKDGLTGVALVEVYLVP